MAMCQQCGRPAVVGYKGGLNFCLDCNLKFQQAQDMILYRMEREHNRLDDIDMITGLPSTAGRYPERRPPVVMSGTVNNIRIDRSNVGVVNTGSIQSVQVSLTTIEHAGNAALATALKEMIEAVVNSSELGATQKNDAVQMLEMVAADATRPKEQRRPAVVRAVLAGFAEVVKVGASISITVDIYGHLFKETRTVETNRLSMRLFALAPDSLLRRATGTEG